MHQTTSLTETRLFKSFHCHLVKMYVTVHNLDTWYTQKASKLQVSKDLQKFHATFFPSHTTIQCLAF